MSTQIERISEFLETLENEDLKKTLRRRCCNPKVCAPVWEKPREKRINHLMIYGICRKDTADCYMGFNYPLARTCS